jgi:glycosyltransferase involved in cell wall biosynthesis
MIDLFVLPSLSEGLPISLLEAMASGKPVVASAVGGITEVITNQNEGELVSSADPNSISIAVRRLFREPERMEKMALIGRESVKNRFSSSIMANQYLNLYSNLET